MTAAGTPRLDAPAAVPSGPRAADWVELTKPRITLLLVVTCAAGLVAATAGWPPLGVTLGTLVGLALSSGGASALNHVLDRDIDAIMARTANRPVAAGRVSPAAGTAFGLLLMAAGGALVAATSNWLAAALSVAGGAFYVVGYTMILKRSTAQNIVIGGAAGAVPPLVGWAAATGTLEPLAWFMFAVVFLWTPPHFWALAMLIRDDYAKAGVPMLPVVAGSRRTATSITTYSLILVVVTLVPVVTGDLGLPYAIAAAVLGGRFIAIAVQLQRVVASGASDDAVRATARHLFLYSMTYLALLFAAVLVDRLI